MRFSRSARLCAAAAFVGSVGLGTVIAVSSGPAGATGETSITCKKISGSATGTSTISKCNGNTGGSSQPLMSSSLISGGTVTWKNGDTTTIGTPTVTTLKNTLKCKAPNSNLGISAPVTADTTGLLTLGTAKGAVCLNNTTEAITASKPFKIT